MMVAWIKEVMRKVQKWMESWDFDRGEADESRGESEKGLPGKRAGFGASITGCESAGKNSS